MSATSPAKAVVGWILVTILAAFVVLNLDTASVSFFGIRVQMPIGLLVLFAAALGAGAFHAFTYLKRRSRSRV